MDKYPDKEKRGLRPMSELKEKIIERLSSGEKEWINQREFNELAGAWKNGTGIINLVDIIDVLNKRKIGQKQIAGFYSRSKSRKVKKLVMALLTFRHPNVQLFYL